MYNYFVVVDHPDYKDEIHEELKLPTGSDTVPAREVLCTNPLPGSEYNGLFMLTDAEAEQLKSDDRVRDVHRVPEEIGSTIESHT